MIIHILFFIIFVSKVYPVLEILGPYYRLMFISSLLLIATFVYGLGEKINKYVWKNESKICD